EWADPTGRGPDRGGARSSAAGRSHRPAGAPTGRPRHPHSVPGTRQPGAARGRVPPCRNAGPTTEHRARSSACRRRLVEVELTAEAALIVFRDERMLGGVAAVEERESEGQFDVAEDHRVLGPGDD